MRLHLSEKPKNDVLEIDSSEDEQPHKTSSSPARKGNNSSSRLADWTEKADVER